MIKTAEKKKMLKLPRAQSEKEGSGEGGFEEGGTGGGWELTN